MILTLQAGKLVICGCSNSILSIDDDTELIYSPYNYELNGWYAVNMCQGASEEDIIMNIVVKISKTSHYK